MLKTLEEMCLFRYLEYLEVECHNWVHLRSSGSQLLRSAVDRILPLLRLQLTASMSGTSSTNIRSAMMREILSGKFPSARYRNIVRPVPHDEMRAAGSLQDKEDDKVSAFISKIRGRTAKCANMCCNGAFIVETMALVVMNDEIKELVFEPEPLRKAWKSGQIAEYVPFNYPALLASYKHYLTVDSPCSEEFFNFRPIALERIRIGRFDLLLCQHKGFRVLRSYANTREYLQFMKYLGPRWSWDMNIWEPDHVIVPACDWPGLDKTGYLPNAQHAMYALTDLFTPKWFREATFHKLTEISLGSDFVTNFCEQEGTPLFSAMGRAVPNLRVLDLSGLIRLRGESVLYLFFHDAFQSLHEYMYLHEHQYELDEAKSYGSIYLDNQHQDGQEGRLHRHGWERYCPWCVDHGAANALRFGCEFNTVVFSVIDPRLWDFVESGKANKATASAEDELNSGGGGGGDCDAADSHSFAGDTETRKVDAVRKESTEELVRTALMYSVSSSHLYQSVTAVRRRLDRPPGLKCFEEGFVPEPGTEDKMQYDGQDKWYPPAQIRYVPDEDLSVPVLNPVASSLQILSMPGTSLKGEMIPFLLRACPRLKSLGHGGSIPYGLELFASLQEAEGVESDPVLLSLEEVEIDFDHLDETEQQLGPDYDEKYGTADTISTNSPNFSFLLANFGQNVFRPPPAEAGGGDEEENGDGAGAKETIWNFATRVYKQAALYAPDEDIEARILKYVAYIVRYVKRLRRLSLFITAPFGSDVEEDTTAWDRLLELEHLEELEVRYARFEDVSGLVRTIGKKLKKLKTYCIPSRHGIAELMNWMMGGLNSDGQYALVLCESCPDLEELDCNSLVYNFHFGRQIICQPGHFARLRSLYVGYITWDTLLQIWQLAVSLEILKLTGVVESPTMASLSVISLDKKRVDTLLQKNRMEHLNTIMAVKLEMDSYSAAHFLISQLPSIVSVSKLIIREEPLEEGVEMSQEEWEDWLARRKEELGLNVAWSGKFLFQDEEDD